MAVFRFLSSQGMQIAPATDVYKSMEEAQADLENPLYRTSRQFAAKVNAKWERSYQQLAGHLEGDVPTETYMQVRVPDSAWDPVAKKLKDDSYADVSTDPQAFLPVAQPDATSPEERMISGARNAVSVNSLTGEVKSFENGLRTDKPVNNAPDPYAGMSEDRRRSLQQSAEHEARMAQQNKERLEAYQAEQRRKRGQE
jgi:hypothetical protein